MPAPETSRDRVLTDEELIEVLRAAEGIGYPFGPFVRVLAFTGQRLREVGEAEWNEFDLENGYWAIPADRAKNKKPHDVRLSTPVLSILKGLPKMQGSPFVFTTTGTSPISGYSNAKETLDAMILEARRRTNPDAQPMPQWVLHDLRRTMTTGMAAMGVAPHVADRVLNHKTGSIQGVAAVYNRFQYREEQARALEAWGDRVMALLEGRPQVDNVIPLERRA